MNKFDFDTSVDRRNSGSYKWDSMDSASGLPMWVADMDFQTAPAIIDALAKRVQHGVFGYAKVPDTYYSAFTAWFERRHNFHIERDWVLYTSGVVPAISAILKALTQPGDKVIVQTPVYNCFFSSIRNMECEALESPLRYEDGLYQMDFEDLERIASGADVKVLLLCNPHNPVGRAWSRDELKRLADICVRNDVIVVSDEIHCDLVFPGVQHQPFAALGEQYLQNSVTCLSPSKSFNIAGLQIANIVVKDESLRARVDKALNVHEVCDVNPFGITALIAAYQEGEAWLDELRAYLYNNYLALNEFVADKLPALKVVKQEATYLAWLDIRALNISSEQAIARLSNEGDVLLNAGTLYGAAGEGFIRINMACPKHVLLDGLQRIEKVFGA